MTDTRALLRRVLASGYARLHRRLAQRLGSDGLAGDVLHETWVRLGQGGELGPVENPEAYVYRVAINTAHRLRAAGDGRAQALDLDAIEDLADETAGPDRAIESQQQMRIVARALDDLSDRQRDVFLACYVHGTPSEVLAARYQVSVRTIQTDLRAAVVHCAKRLGRKDVFADRTFRVSRK
jgi:RNA polymerase sigma factor (sigma-70 family)